MKKSIVLTIAVLLGLSGCGSKPKPVNQEVLNGKLDGTIVLHRDSSFMGGGLNMFVAVNGHIEEKQLMTDETNTYEIKHNGLAILQVEDEIVEIKLEDKATVKCEVVPHAGSEFIKNMFFINGFSPKLNVTIDCI